MLEEYYINIKVILIYLNNISMTRTYADLSDDMIIVGEKMVIVIYGIYMKKQIIIII